MARHSVSDNYCSCFECRRFRGMDTWREDFDNSKTHKCQLCGVRDTHIILYIPEDVKRVLKLEYICQFCRNHLNAIMYGYLDGCWGRATDTLMEIVGVIHTQQQLQSEILHASGYWERVRAKYESKPV